MNPSGDRLPPFAPNWTCVRDTVTGLLWEVKTDDGGLRDKDAAYARDDHGVANYIARVNETGLCGRQDWRLPTRAELLGLVDFSKLPGEGIDTTWFPNPPPVATWTSSCATCDYYNWAFRPWADPALGEYFYLAWFEESLAIRLVSDAGQVPGPTGRYRLDGGEATDEVTGLIWKRCSEGTQFADATCRGTPLRLTWSESGKHARAEARRTGQAWRLPNVKELDSLLDLTRSASFDAVAFPGLDDSPFWTATAYSQQASKAWCVQFGNAHLSLMGEFGDGCKPKGRVLLVRNK